jgi:hypothetical protein
LARNNPEKPIFAATGKEMAKTMFNMLSPAQIAATMREIPRFQLMFATLECFIRSLRKLDKSLLDSLDPRLISWYGAEEGQMGAFIGNIRPSERRQAAQLMGNDMLLLFNMFEANPEVAALEKFQVLSRVLSEYCLVTPGNRTEVALRNLDDVVSTVAWRDCGDSEEDGMEPFIVEAGK